MSEPKEKAFIRKRKAHRLFWLDLNIWRIIPPLNVAESNWASVAALVPFVELKGFSPHQFGKI